MLSPRNDAVPDGRPTFGDMRDRLSPNVGTPTLTTRGHGRQNRAVPRRTDVANPSATDAVGGHFPVSRRTGSNSVPPPAWRSTARDQEQEGGAVVRANGVESGRGRKLPYEQGIRLRSRRQWVEPTPAAIARTGRLSEKAASV